MSDLFDRISTFFRENPRMWIVLVAALAVGVFSVWTIYGGFSLEIGRFFAASDQDVGDGGGGGGAPAASTASCGSLGGTVCKGRGAGGCGAGFTDVGQKTTDCDSGYGFCCKPAPSGGGDGGGGAPAVNPSASTASCGSLGGTVCKGRGAGGCGAGFTDVGQKTTDCDSGYGFCCKPSSSGGGSGGPTDPTGACTFRTAFNAPEGAWFCNALQCQLDGNPSGGQEFPPQGPATTLAVKVFRTIEETVNPSDGPIHIRTVLDATPKCGNGKECYPNKDPLWVCTAAPGVMYQGGRDGHDFYDCYNPIIHRTNYGPITCCAGTNLSGDCFTWNLAAPPGGAPAPGTPPSGGLPTPAQLSVQCGTNQNVLSWVTPLPAGSNASAINKTSTAPGGSPVAVQIGVDLGKNPSSYTDTDVQPGYTYSYRFKNHVSVASNTVTCPTAAAPTPTPSPTQSVAPTVSAAPGSPVECAPVTQTVQVNQIARLEAAGGNGVYTWNITGGGLLEEGGNQYIGVRYPVAGRKVLRLNGSGTSAQCSVEVVSGTPTVSVSPTALTLQKSGRNTTVSEPADDLDVTVYPGQTAQFTIRVANNGSTALNNVKLTDTVPPGMSYRSGSTRVQNQAVAADSVTTAGLVIGQLDPGETVSVQWTAVADRTTTITAGPNLSSPAARVTADGVSDAVSDMSVTVYGSGATSGAGGVPTGPGDAVLAALLTAVVLTLLYSGYTRSAAYRRREAEIVSKDQGPLDFRS